jgi:hypothetical protein
MNWGNPEKGPKSGLYVPTSWRGGGLGARPEGMPRVGEPQEKEHCVGPPAALGYGDGSSRGGAVLPGGLQVGSPVTVCRSTTTTSSFIPKLVLPQTPFVKKN